MAQSDPQEIYVPPKSRANVEQEYFNKEFGAFFRINTGWLSPTSPTGDPVKDNIFKHPYMDYMAFMQDAIVSGISISNDNPYILDNFCYKPITGQGCLVESPLQYYQNDYQYCAPTTNEENQLYATCTVQVPGTTGRICFDDIGTPVLTFAVFGGQTCSNVLTSDCDTCDIIASAMQLTFLLNKNAYSISTAEDWEAQVFIWNFKSFNYAMNTTYNIDLDGPLEGVKDDYNWDLINKIWDYHNSFITNNEAQKCCTALNATGACDECDVEGMDIFTLKADYLAERSVEDNIQEESAENAAVAVISYILMLVYVSIALGFFPSIYFMSFGLGLVGIFVVIFSLICGLGFTFYFNQKATMISVEVVPFLLLAIGVDNIFLIGRAERSVPDWVTDVDERIGFAMKEIGPSIFTAALCESIAFFVGLLTDVPALQNFCLIAGIGVVSDFFLQILLFVPALSIDRKRLKEKRADLLFCCWKFGGSDEDFPQRRNEIVRPLFQKYYVPMLFTKRVMGAVFGIALSLTTIGVFSCFELQLGLN